MTDVRPLEPKDHRALAAFFARLPDGELAFIQDNVREPAALAALWSDDRGRRYAAVAGGQIIGYAAVIPRMGWSSHVGEIRLLVAPDYRRQGIGRMLARYAFIECASAWPEQARCGGGGKSARRRRDLSVVGLQGRGTPLRPRAHRPRIARSDIARPSSA